MIKPYACMRCMAQSDDTICPVCGATAEDAQRALEDFDEKHPRPALWSRR